jgi:hypothetical protein
MDYSAHPTAASFQVPDDNGRRHAERLLPGELAGEPRGLQLAGQRPTPHRFRRRLNDAQPSSKHEGLLRIVEPPFRAMDCSAVRDA